MMVGFSRIGVIDKNGGRHAFYDLEGFYQYQKEIWNTLDPEARALRYERFYFQQNLVEKWEISLGFPRDSLRGIPLIFGDWKLTRRSINSRLVQQFFTWPSTLATIQFDAINRTVRGEITSEAWGSFQINYPFEEAWLDDQETLNEQRAVRFLTRVFSELDASLRN